MKLANKRKLKSVTAAMLAFSLLAGFGWLPKSAAEAKIYTENQYEAETASLNNVTTNTNHNGYTGSGFVDGFGDSGDSVQFTINISTAEDTTLRFRYTNYTGATNVREIYVDGNFVSNAYFADTGSWDTWNTTDVGTALSSGTHTVKVAVENSSDGYLNLDNLVVTPKHVSVRSLYTSNWNNMMSIWQASKLYDTDTSSGKGPRLSELRYSGNWSQNQIQDYAGFFRDETNNVKYDQTHNFDSEAYFDEDGILHTNYLKYDGSKPSVEISRDYATVPNQNLIVTRYALKNSGSSSATYSLLDMLHPSNSTSNTISASYDSSRKAIIVNMNASSQPYLALGAFAAPSYYQAANDTDSSTSSQTCSPWYTFDGSGTLKNNASVSAQDVSAAFEQTVTIPAGGTQYVYFYLGLGTSLNEIQALCNTAASRSGSDWFEETANDYQNWFSEKTVPSLSDSDLTALYKRNLVMIKNSIRPGSSTGDGAMPATTNPANYGYKIWSRDSAVTAMALDAAGFTDEAETYWKWLAARQNSDGTFHTCYGLWDNTNQNFVEPENDSIGMFLIGVYRHYKLTGDQSFLSALYSAVQKSANYIMNNINQSTGFGPADKSIWEEGDTSEYYTYTQAAYAMGLKSAALISTVMGNAALTDSYNGAGSSILTAINRDDSSQGLWNVSNGYYNRCVNSDLSNNTLEDSSTNILFALGAIDVNSSRASRHISKLETDLAHDVYGLPRYSGDTFYYTSQWSPGGNEALEASPSWPQMTMWDAVYQIYSGNPDKAYNMLEWFKHRTATGWMVTGEAASNVTEAPCVSTASEPVTAAAFVLASLAYADNYDMRVYASENNSGCYKSISVTSGASGDWSQYQYVPYYVDAPGDTAVSDSRTDIKKVYISNDANNIYIRINNEAGALPGSSQNEFKVSVYTEDFSNSASTTTHTIHDSALGRNMAFLFTRSNTDSAYNKYTVSGGSWSLNKTISSVIAPQWDTATGGIELVIPRSDIGSPSNDAWGHITVVLEKYQNGSYLDQDTAQLNYRLTGGSESWLYGNFE
ncbi:CBM35 domain-containing protein [Caproicibacter sp.]|uniref:CBM35 domain-containing protein n=1 Tax=Caproicibacter sp. TaxID=2814884 RepID=UPI00398A35BB